MPGAQQAHSRVVEAQQYFMYIHMMNPTRRRCGTSERNQERQE
jgi:hypothetical protein